MRIMEGSHPVWIYMLVDPREPRRARYVGRTTLPRGRLAVHICTPHGKVRPWILALRRHGLRPKMVITRFHYERRAVVALKPDLNMQPGRKS